LFPDLFAKPLVAAFDQPHVSSDGGAVLLKAADRRVGLTNALAGGFSGPVQRWNDPGREFPGPCSREQVSSFPEKRKGFDVTIIEIRPFRNGWQVSEAAGVQPVFLSQEQAIDYATCRACFRSGEIRILDSNGAIERLIPFNETDRQLWCKTLLLPL
jgi:hypothetical protein